MIKRIFQTAVFAGLGAALMLTLIQAVWVSPLILKAETYEQAASTHHAEAHEGDEHHHDDEGWTPEDGWQRATATAGANLVVGVAFGLFLAGAVSLRPPRKVVTGALWGLAGYAVFVLAPAAGLPPELPGTQAADLHARQLWWVGTAIATAIGLGLLAFSPMVWTKVAAVVLMGIPHLIGAPHLASAQMLAQEDLYHKFVAASLVSDALFWVTLGLLSALFYRRAERSEPLASPPQEYA